MIRLRSLSQIYYGWLVIAAMFVVAMYVGGAVFYGFTTIIEPIAAEMAWATWVVTLAASLRGVESSLLAPVVGAVVDRFGPRRLMFGGVITTAAGLVLLSQTQNLGTYFTAFVLITLGTATTNMTVIVTVVGHWFHRRLGLVNGISISGFAFGGVLVPVINALIESYDWRLAMLALAGGMIVFILPLLHFVRMPDAAHPRDEAEFTRTASDRQAAPGIIPESDFSTRQALRSRAFMHLMVAYFCFAVVVVSVITHIMPYLTSIGISRFSAGWLVMAFPVTSILGRLGLGWVSDHWQTRATIILAFLMTALGMVFLGLAENRLVWLVPFMLIYTIGYGGSIAIRPTLVREYFGRARFGTIFGSLMAISMLGGVAGPPLAGWVYDTTGSYQMIWYIYTSLLLVAYLALQTSPKPGVRA